MVYTMYMDLVIRKLDDGFVQRIRVESAIAGKSVKEWVIWALEAHFANGGRVQEVAQRGSDQAERVVSADSAMEGKSLVDGVARDEKGFRSAEDFLAKLRIPQKIEATLEEPAGVDCPNCAGTMLFNEKLRQWNCECGFIDKRRKR